MRNKHTIARALALLLCLTLASFPLMGMAAGNAGDGQGDGGAPEASDAPAPVCICETPCAADAPNADCPACALDAGHCTGQEPPPAPVCVCEALCSADAPNADCPVCAVDAGQCTGQEPPPAPVCVCEALCTADAPNADCPVCVTDAAGCQGEAPVPAFTIRILRPSGWYTDRAYVTVRVIDDNKTGWEKVEAKIEKNGAWTDLTDALAEQDHTELAISENCTVYVTVTDQDGKAHSKSAYIQCFDREAPTLRAGIDGELLRVEASDDLSGVAYIYVNGYRFTGMVNGTLDVSLKSYADEYEQMSVVAVDYAGNKSKTVQVKNPYYGNEDKDSDAHDSHCPDDCDCRETETPTITTTPTPSTTPQTSGNGGKSAAASSPAPTTTPSPDMEAAEITAEPGTGFAQNGNAVTRDLLYDQFTNKQFITVQDRDGNTFYIVIDYDAPLNEEEEQYQTYFLNLVDAADLAALAEDGEGEEAPAACACTDKCAVGAINTACPVCSVNMSECVGKEAEPEPTETPEPVDAPEESGGMGGVLAVVLLLAVAGGGALYFFKVRKKKPQTKGDTDLDEYDFDEDEDEDGLEDAEDPEADPEDEDE